MTGGTRQTKGSNKHCREITSDTQKKYSDVMPYTADTYKWQPQPNLHLKTIYCLFNYTSKSLLPAEAVFTQPRVTRSHLPSGLWCCTPHVVEAVT